MDPASARICQHRPVHGRVAPGRPLLRGTGSRQLERLLGPFTRDPHLRLSLQVALQVL
ncbi:MAG TPA: hypothetical protein VI248_04420 [Kineosporiaceae bacterium]